MNQHLEADAAWLRFAPLSESTRAAYHPWLQRIVVKASRTSGLDTAVSELTRALPVMLNQEVPVLDQVGPGTLFLCVGRESVLGEPGLVDVPVDAVVKNHGYLVYSRVTNGAQSIALYAQTDEGLLYAVFHFLRIVQQGQPIDGLRMVQNPPNRLRFINHWDNFDGSIERGYAGKSIFFRNNEILVDNPRIPAYARLLASVGINAITINNVNVHRAETELITPALLPKVAKIADIFRAYGITLFLSVNYASPMQLAGLSTADPLDERVAAWWREAAATVYRYIPDFGGFLVKADSEGRPGPFTYGRDHADGANMLAAAVAPFGGSVIWRCFVYNHLQDWRDRSTDRARAAYDNFKPLDGRFADNVILQIKNGPMDFQVREAVSPLLGALAHTNEILELQITQEYTGQQRHLCYLLPQWKEVTEFDTCLKEIGSNTSSAFDRVSDTGHDNRGKVIGSKVADAASGALHNRPLGGFAAVSNIGDDASWTGHYLAQANLYGYGRLAWDPDLTALDIASEWTRLTFGRDEQAAKTIVDMLMASWPIYENYTSPLGVGWMVTPHYHYGPDVDGYEYSKWGTYHFADRDGIGVDRTMATGTGYTAQYAAPNRELYDSLETCPDELLLFFHHVPYTHRLHSGKTVIQHIYDTHFEGVEQVEGLVEQWESLKGRMDGTRYEHVLARLRDQAEHAKEWRDIINTYFWRKSGIEDEKGRKIYR